MIRNALWPIAVSVALVALVPWSTGCEERRDAPPESGAAEAAAAEAPETSEATETSQPTPPAEQQDAPQPEPTTTEPSTQAAESPTPKPKENPMVIIQTSKGTIRVELFADKAPKTVENFLAYVDEEFYDGTIFHRVIPDFMIQGGGFTPQMQQKRPNDPIENEATNGLKNERGTLAMARTGEPHSATAQFFINVVDNDFLNHTAPTERGWGYAVFGKVIDGMDVVDKIRGVPTGNAGMYENVPREPVVIESIRRVEQE